MVDLTRRTVERALAAVGALAVGVLLLAALLAAVSGLPTGLFFTPTDTGASAGLAADDVEYDVVAEDLDVPWEVVPLDGDRYLVTERTGDLVLLEDGERTVLESFEDLDEPFLGEGGLLGLAIHPDFEENGQLYVFATLDREGVENTIRRYEADLEAGELREETVIVDGIPSDRIHNGGRLAFGPDGYLYAMTGDAADADLAGDRDSLAGKTLRYEADGTTPDDNPFGTAVYSYGHRNAQGLAFDDDGTLWSTEHGPAARDELNRIEPGEHYGWPEITGTETHPEFVEPTYTSGKYETWAPAGATVHDGSVFFAGLRGERLYEARVHDGGVQAFVAHFGGDFGRLRAVTLSPDGEHLYVTTSNTDGRGDERAGDDKLIRIPTEAFR